MMDMARNLRHYYTQLPVNSFYYRYGYTPLGWIHSTLNFFFSFLTIPSIYVTFYYTGTYFCDRRVARYWPGPYYYRPSHLWKSRAPYVPEPARGSRPAYLAVPTLKSYRRNKFIIKLRL